MLPLAAQGQMQIPALRLASHTSSHFKAGTEPWVQAGFGRLSVQHQQLTFKLGPGNPEVCTAPFWCVPEKRGSPSPDGLLCPSLPPALAGQAPGRIHSG